MVVYHLLLFVHVDLAFLYTHARTRSCLLLLLRRRLLLLQRRGQLAHDPPEGGALLPLLPQGHRFDLGGRRQGPKDLGLEVGQRQLGAEGRLMVCVCV